MQPLPTETLSSGFTPAEVARLAVYRAAVAAGFYTDWGLDDRPLTGARSLSQPPPGHDSASWVLLPYPFTAQELARLDTYRRAVQAGIYTDRMPASG